MRTHIDWLSFTMTPRYITTYPDTFSFADMYADAIERAWKATFTEAVIADAFGGIWEGQERSRPPYKDAWTLTDAGITLFSAPNLNHCTVEISGQGCERLIALNLLNEVLTAISERVTRIDIACDIETDVRPTEFVAELSHKKMQSSGYQKSNSGETCYVGSQKSDRYARAYRYADPHPRSHLLRIEHVFRKEYAKSVAQAIIENGVNNVAIAAGKAFGWAHSAWKTTDDNDISIGVVSGERNAGKTIFWLVNSVAPAFRRLVDDGTIIDPDTFIRRYFLVDNE